MSEKIHQQVRNWIDSEELLDAKTEATLQEHLRACPDCRSYVDMIIQLRGGEWNPFPRQRLSQAATQKITQQIRPQIRSNKMKLNAGAINLSSALGLIGLIAVVSLFALALSRMNQTAVPPATITATENYIQYDGWETGAAFQFPDTWHITDFEIDNGVIAMFTTPLNETAAPCTPFLDSDTNAAAWVLPFDPAIPLTPIEFLERYIEVDELSVQEGPEAVTVDGRSAAYTLAEIPCDAPFNQMTVMTTETETQHVLFGLRHAPDGAEAARTELETMISSLAKVDYAGWQLWQPEGFLYTVMTPQDWNVFDTLKSMQLTTSSQPMWSSYADPNQPVNPNPVNMNLFHNLNSQFGDTPQAVVERHVAQMAAELTMAQIQPPTAHPFIPGLVTAVYTTEDTAIFFGALAYPRNTISLDPIGAMATVPLDQLDSFGDTFERVLRSLNGYYVADIPLRDTIRGSEYMPTATPIPITEPTTTGNSELPITPTPTAVNNSADVLVITATPFPPTAVPQTPLLITPTAVNASTEAPVSTATPIPQPTEP